MAAFSAAWRTTHLTTFSLVPEPHTVPLWVTQRKIRQSSMQATASHFILGALACSSPQLSSRSASGFVQTSYPDTESLPRRKNPICGLRTHPLVCGHEETTAAIEQVIISIQISSTDQPAARNKQETAAKIFTFMLQNVFHAIRTDASPA
jgi:hypothetical protein